jgi:phosphoglycerol transferase MdoB-like AlkP superfamily enzyme
MSKIKYIFKLYIVSLVALFATRALLYGYYFDYFNDLTLLETLSSFLVGIRIDIMSLNTFIGVLILLFALPFKFTANRYYKAFFGYIWFVILGIIIFVNIADIFYFGFFYKHIDSTLIALNNNIAAVFGFAKSFIWYIIALCFILYILFRYWQKLINSAIEVPSYKSLFGTFLLLFIFTIYGARGCKIGGKPFNISDAYVTNKISGANLSVSGFYSFYRNSYNISPNQQNYHFYKQDDAIATVQSILTTDQTIFVDKNYPFKRKFKNIAKKKKYNVCIILLESFSRKFVDSLNGNIGLNATPFLDTVINSGIKFTNAFANGRQSIDGIGAVLAGVVPPANSNLYFGRGLEASRFSYLGNIFKNNGYSTVAMQSSSRNSFRVDSITKVAGFDSYFGAEDFKTHQHGEDKDKMPHYGTWDGDMLNRYFKEIDKIKKPFLSFTFTSTTHFPFYLPSKKYAIYPHDKTSLVGYLNTMRYTDDMVKDFINKAKKTSWFKDTIFVFVADHTAPITNRQIKEFEKLANKKLPDSKLERYRILLSIYAPYILKPSVNTNYISQADILPSLVDLLGFNDSFSTISNSVFSSNNHFVFAKEGNIYTYFTKDGYTIRNTNKLFRHKNIDYSKQILSIHQILVDSLNKNRFY